MRLPAARLVLSAIVSASIEFRDFPFKVRCRRDFRGTLSQKRGVILDVWWTTRPYAKSSPEESNRAWPRVVIRSLHCSPKVVSYSASFSEYRVGCEGIAIIAEPVCQKGVVRRFLYQLPGKEGVIVLGLREVEHVCVRSIARVLKGE